MNPLRSAARFATPFSLQTARKNLARMTLLGGGAAALVVPAPASALTISGTNVGTLPATNPVHADASTKSVIYYFDLHAGATDERFGVSLTPPSFATTGGRDEGQSVDGPLQVTLQGPGTVGQMASDPAFGSLCSDRDDRYHGYDTGKAVVDVQLPAGANTTLAVRYGVGRRAPWTDTDLTMHFGVLQRLVGTYDAASPLFGPATDVAAAQTISVTKPIPVLASGAGSKIGAHLILTPSPAGTYGEGKKAKSISKDTRVKVIGRLLPALSGKKVLLQWAKPNGKLRTAASAKTTSGGRFKASLKAPGAGAYELWAGYPKQSGTLTSDSTSCPIRYQVK